MQSGPHVYQCLDRVEIHYHVNENDNDGDPHHDTMLLSWIAAALSHVRESAHVYDNQLRTIYINNRLGTLTSASPRSMQTASDVFRHLERFYVDSTRALYHIREAIKTARTLTFAMTMRDGRSLSCRCIPAFGSRANVIGVVVLGEIEQHGTEIRGERP